MFKNTLAIAWKEIQLMLKDRGSLAILFLLPLLFGAVYGGMNLKFADTDDAGILVRVGVVNLDTGIFGEEITAALHTIDELQITDYETAAEAEAPVATGEAAAAIVIPAGFTEQVNAYTPTEIEVIVDPAQPESASIVTGIMNQVVDEATIWGEIQYGIRAVLEDSDAFTTASPEQQQAFAAQNLGVIMTQLNEMRRNPAIAVVSEDLEGATIEGGIEIFFALMFPGLTVMFVFFIVGVCAASLLNEREAGTLRRLLAAPLTPSAIIGGKTLAYMALACAQVVVLLGVAAIFFNMPLGASPLALLPLTVILAFVAAAMGMMIAALSKTPKQADTTGTVLGFVLAGIGGCIAMGPTPLTRTTGFIGILSKLTPHAHALEAYYSLMGENATFVQVLPEMGILLAMGLLFFTIAAWRFRFTD
ncbi:MAG: ABC transporter permease [Anaerolineae bacterium]|nr:ABC transporter permease [Anaerolineae bacterium]